MACLLKPSEYEKGIKTLLQDTVNACALVLTYVRRGRLHLAVNKHLQKRAPDKSYIHAYIPEWVPLLSAEACGSPVLSSLPQPEPI